MTALQVLAPRRRWFARVCTKKLALKKNLAKPDPRRDSYRDLLLHLKDEVAELEHAMLMPGLDAEAIGECADIANVAAFIADKLNAMRRKA